MISPSVSLTVADYIFSNYIKNNSLVVKGKPIEIPNVNRISLAKMLGELGYKIGAEVGVEQGIYSKVLLENNKELKLYCIDPWKAYDGYREHVSQEKLDKFVEITKQRLENYNYEIVRDFSPEVANKFKDEFFDFVYVDGNHDLPHAVNDICAWWPKVRKGGILAGHDYINRSNPKLGMHVPQAIKAFMDSYHVGPLYVLGRKDKLPGELRDNTRSWFIIKE